MTTIIGINNIIGQARKYKKGLYSRIKPIARYSAKGKTNQDTDRDILKDLTDNGHDINLKNFGYSMMSGYGRYEHNFKSWTNHAMSSSIPCTDSTWVGNGFSDDGGWWLLETIVTNSPSFRIKVSGLIGSAYLTCVYRTEDTSRILTLDRNQEYEIPASENNTRPFTLGFLGYFFVENDAIVTIEQIPEYQNSLIFDGIADYGINDNFPILTDYTVICKKEPTLHKGGVISKMTRTNTVETGAFIIDDDMKSRPNAMSFGYYSDIKRNNNRIITQTKNYYNNIFIKSGSTEDNSLLFLGIYGRVDGIDMYFSNIILYDLIIYDRTLSREEINSEILKYNL